ncbi:MAG TPA: FAD/NAD(P)-binding protein [Micavibrio sp.]
MTTIAIVGGGFSGAMLLYHLMTLDHGKALKILWFDQHNRFGRGVAYSTPADEHLLNVPGRMMSALPDEPDDFINWLGGGDAGKFYGRRMYGEYLRGFHDRALAMAAEKGHEIIPIPRSVARIGKSSLTAEGEDYSFDALVLATGAQPPRWPSLPERNADDPRLIHSPYQGAINIPKGIETVVILGTGLSSVDAILSLDRAGYGGRIICISRHGLWPRSHRPRKFWNWRTFIDALRPRVNGFWTSCPRAARRFMLRHLTWWNIVRHRMPQECELLLQSLRNSGRMETRNGTIQAIACHPSHIEIQMDRGSVQGGMVINCLGYLGAGIMSQPLLRQMAEDGLIRVKDGVLDPVPGSWSKISDSSPIYTLGPPLFGALIETTAVPVIRGQAVDLAAEIFSFAESRT